jgi:hypothetical protein
MREGEEEREREPEKLTSVSWRLCSLGKSTRSRLYFLCTRTGFPWPRRESTRRNVARVMHRGTAAGAPTP